MPLSDDDDYMSSSDEEDTLVSYDMMGSSSDDDDGATNALSAIQEAGSSICTSSGDDVSSSDDSDNDGVRGGVGGGRGGRNQQRGHHHHNGSKVSTAPSVAKYFRHKEELQRRSSVDAAPTASTSASPTTDPSTDADSSARVRPSARGRTAGPPPARSHGNRQQRSGSPIPFGGRRPTPAALVPPKPGATPSVPIDDLWASKHMPDGPSDPSPSAGVGLGVGVGGVGIRSVSGVGLGAGVGLGVGVGGVSNLPTTAPNEAEKRSMDNMLAASRHEHHQHHYHEEEDDGASDESSDDGTFMSFKTMDTTELELQKLKRRQTIELMYQQQHQQQHAAAIVGGVVPGVGVGVGRPVTPEEAPGPGQTGGPTDKVGAGGAATGASPQHGHGLRRDPLVRTGSFSGQPRAQEEFVDTIDALMRETENSLRITQQGPVPGGGVGGAGAGGMGMGMGITPMDGETDDLGTVGDTVNTGPPGSTAPTVGSNSVRTPTGRRDDETLRDYWARKERDAAENIKSYRKLNDAIGDQATASKESSNGYTDLSTPTPLPPVTSLYRSSAESDAGGGVGAGEATVSSLTLESGVAGLTAANEYRLGRSLHPAAPSVTEVDEDAGSDDVAGERSEDDEEDDSVHTPNLETAAIGNGKNPQLSPTGPGQTLPQTQIVGGGGPTVSVPNRLGSTGLDEKSHGYTSVVSRVLSQAPDLHAILAANDWTSLDQNLLALGKNPHFLSASLTATDDVGATPLHTACWKAPPPLSLHMISLLPRIYQDMQRICLALDCDGNTALHLCAANTCMENQDKAEYNDHLDFMGDLEFRSVAGFKETDVLEALVLSAPEAATMQNNEGDTPLHLAVSSPLSSVLAVSILLDANVGVCITQDIAGSTPLHAAIANQVHEEVLVRLLISAPRSAVIPDHKGLLPLHYVAAFCHTPIEFVRKLIAANKAGIMSQTEDGDTPLHLAISNAQSDDELTRRIVQLLLGQPAGDMSRSPLSIKNKAKLDPLECCDEFDAPAILKQTLMQHAKTLQQQQQQQQPQQPQQSLFPQVVPAVEAAAETTDTVQAASATDDSSVVSKERRRKKKEDAERRAAEEEESRRKKQEDRRRRQEERKKKEEEKKRAEEEARAAAEEKAAAAAAAEEEEEERKLKEAEEKARREKEETARKRAEDERRRKEERKAEEAFREQRRRHDAMRKTEEKEAARSRKRTASAGSGSSRRWSRRPAGRIESLTKRYPKASSAPRQNGLPLHLTDNAEVRALASSLSLSFFCEKKRINAKEGNVRSRR